MAVSVRLNKPKIGEYKFRRKGRPGTKCLRVVEGKSIPVRLSWLGEADVGDRSVPVRLPDPFLLCYTQKSSRMQRVLYVGSSRMALRNVQLTAGRRGRRTEPTGMSTVTHPKGQASARVLYGVQ